MALAPGVRLGPYEIVSAFGADPFGYASSGRSRFGKVLDAASRSRRRRHPLYAGRCLFDLMITEGLHRGVHWHTWLIDFEYWTDRIVQNMASLDPDVDLSREYQTPYHYLLYEIFTTQP